MDITIIIIYFYFKKSVIFLAWWLKLLIKEISKLAYMLWIGNWANLLSSSFTDRQTDGEFKIKDA